MQHEGGDAARAPEIRSNAGPPATPLPRPAVSLSGLARGGTAALQQQQLREMRRIFPSEVRRGRRGVRRSEVQVEAAEDEERERKGRREGVAEERGGRGGLTLT